MTTKYEDTADCNLVKNVYEDIFNHTLMDFMRKNQDPDAAPSQILRNGEEEWKRLSNGKKVAFMLKTLRSENRYARKKHNPRSAEEQNGMEENMDVEYILDDPEANARLLDACCPPKKRKRRKPCCPPRKRRKPNPCCPKKRKPRCPKKRKPRCPRKRKPACPRKKKRC